jgi:hypothetical protein
MVGRHRKGRETEKKKQAKEFYKITPVKPAKVIATAKVVKPGKRVTPLDDRD